MTPAQAWTSVVAGEDAAIYAYSVAGARVPDADLRRARAGLDAHRERRSRASLLAADAGGSVPAPQPAYELPGDVVRPRDAAALLADVENALVAVYADAAAASSDADRRWAARCAADCAASAVEWGAPSQAFPQAAPAASSSRDADSGD